MLQKSLFIILLLAPRLATGQESHKALRDFIGMEPTEENLSSLFGTDSYQKQSRNRYQLAYSFSAETGLERNPDGSGEYLRVIKEIYIGSEYLEDRFPGKEILPGLKKKLIYEDAIEALKEIPQVRYLEPGSDMNGKLIEFGYETASSRVVHYHLRYRPLKRSKNKFVAMYIRNYRR